VFCLEVLHSAEQDIKGDAEEVVTDKDIRVCFVQRDCNTHPVSSEAAVQPKENVT
jgi:hypothetical protein